MAARVAFAFSAVFFALGVYLPFWPVWLESRGLSPEMIGVALGLGSWARVGLNPLVGSLVDRTGRTRAISVALALLVLATYSAFAFTRGSLALLALSVALGCGFSPLVPLLDGIAVRASATMDYGRVRRWGSAAFIVASVGVGGLLEEANEDAIVYTLIAASVLLVVAASSLPQAPPPTRTTSTSISMRDMLSRPEFVRFVLACAALHGSHSVLYAYGTPHWRAAGIEESTIGWLWALGVIAEIGLFSVGPRLSDRITPAGWMIAAGIGGLLRWPALALTSSVAWLALAQILHALTFGATHLGAMAMIRRHVEPEATSRATALYSAISTGLAFGVGLPLAGVLYEAMQGTAFMVMAGLSAAGAAIAMGLGRWLARAQETTTVNSTASRTGAHSAEPHTAK